jgi:hypothetical protein
LSTYQRRVHKKRQDCNEGNFGHWQFFSSLWVLKVLMHELGFVIGCPTLVAK